jgi:hemerythrin-like domain-containing protein
MQVRARFVSDHERLEELFKDVLAAFAADDREKSAAAWAEFDSRLLRHMAAEERYLLPKLSRTAPREVRAILEEHGHLRRRLVELGIGVDLHVVRADVARAFIDELRAHASHEDKVLYRLADTELGESDRKSLLRAIVEATVVRVHALTEPRPESGLTK